ncbi:Hypothetical protein IALB_3052 [Ignavibacterium album JCM 16511]|uniref:Uncharacterized protein n=1 Tax=Ignavibacterium album (strain DSM 19864 / JCM 16511 / NBRC 101810 / Mat9-16) TaxID=945713 RepID=I0AP48_IGNAJ|nr:Hypothetical protein IALB_3052 [Ignavibacterium album JCM 16511]
MFLTASDPPIASRYFAITAFACSSDSAFSFCENAFTNKNIVIKNESKRDLNFIFVILIVWLICSGKNTKQYDIYFIHSSIYYSVYLGSGKRILIENYF